MAKLRLDPLVDPLIFNAACSPDDARRVLRIAAQRLLDNEPLSWALARHLATALMAGADADSVKEGAPGKAMALALHLTSKGRRPRLDPIAIGSEVDALLWKEAHVVTTPDGVRRWKMGMTVEVAIGLVVNRRDSDESTVRSAWKAYAQAREEHNAVD